MIIKCQTLHFFNNYMQIIIELLSHFQMSSKQKEFFVSKKYGAALWNLYSFVYLFYLHSWLVEATCNPNQGSASNVKVNWAAQCLNSPNKETSSRNTLHTVQDTHYTGPHPGRRLLLKSRNGTLF